MHTKPVEEYHGMYSKPKPAPEVKCRICGKTNVVYQVWDSSCGAYTDYKYTCQDCHHYWWIDGPDA